MLSCVPSLSLTACSTSETVCALLQTSMWSLGVVTSPFWLFDPDTTALSAVVVATLGLKGQSVEINLVLYLPILLVEVHLRVQVHTVKVNLLFFRLSSVIVVLLRVICKALL